MTPIESANARIQACIEDGADFTVRGGVSPLLFLKEDGGDYDVVMSSLDSEIRAGPFDTVTVGRGPRTGKWEVTASGKGSPTFTAMIPAMHFQIIRSEGWSL